MLRRIISSLALAAIVAAPATAQTIYKFTAANGGSNHTYNKFNGTIDGGHAALGSSSFQIWCVDQTHTFSSGVEYDAYVTQLGVGNDLSDVTRQNDETKYIKAAWLASGMDNNNVSNVTDRQWAIWAVIHGKTAIGPTYTGYCTGSDGGAGTCNGALVQGVLDNMGSKYDNVTKSDWYVITDKSWKNGGSQEFIAHCKPTQPTQEQGIAPLVAAPECKDGRVPPDAEDPTPEPATMSLLAMGLAGLAGNSLRRRKK